MMRAAIIIERAFVRLGGAERSVVELADELIRRGVDAQIIAASGDAGPNTVVLCGGEKRTGLSAFANAIKEYISANRFDIIHSTLPFDFADIYQPRGGSYKAAMLANAASYNNAAIRAFKRITHFANLRRAGCIKAERRICSPPGRPVVAALSEYVGRQFLSHYNLPPARLAVIPNGVGVERIADTGKSGRLRSSILSRTDMSEKAAAVLFLFAANNFHLKGLCQLLGAMSAALKKNSALPAVLAVAGADKHISHYKTVCEKSGLSGRVVFTGHLDSAADAIYASDAAILPTWYDPCSRFILEALAAARPVITTRSNGAAERYVDGRHGIILDSPSEIAALAEAVAAMCDAPLRQRMRSAMEADNLRQAVCLGNHIDKLLELYQTILRRRK